MENATQIVGPTYKNNNQNGRVNQLIVRPNNVRLIPINNTTIRTRIHVIKWVNALPNNNFM